MRWTRRLPWRRAAGYGTQRRGAERNGRALANNNHGSGVYRVYRAALEYILTHVLLDYKPYLRMIVMHRY